MPTTGVPTSRQDEKWYQAAKELTPQRSLEAIETLANFVFANVAVVGTLLTGFGLVAADGALLRSAPQVLSVPLPVLLVGLSLVLATIALVPALARISPALVDEVRRWYTRQILRRGVAIILALLAFAAAIVSATVSAASDEASDPRLSAAWKGTGKRAEVTVKVELSGLAGNAIGRTSIEGVTSRKRVELFKATSRADASGDLTVETALADVGRYPAVEVRFSVRDGAEIVEDARLRLRRP